jgi:glycosyltransferase involved in cell wall biosynthesis
MVERIDGEWYPPDPSVRRSRLLVEGCVAKRAHAATFCTSTAEDIFCRRYEPIRSELHTRVIENGYDPEAFERAAAIPSAQRPAVVHLVHSGTLYPGPDRDPSGLLRAMVLLRDAGRLPAGLRITLRATGFDQVYRRLIDELGLSEFVQLAPSVDYAKALREMLDADGLLLFQGHTSNPAIPAKTYEYLQARRPIFGLLAEDGETAGLLRRAGVGIIAPISDPRRIATQFDRFLNDPAGRGGVLNESAAIEYSRVHRVREFAEFFDEILAAS